MYKIKFFFLTIMALVALGSAVPVPMPTPVSTEEPAIDLSPSPQPSEPIAPPCVFKSPDGPATAGLWLAAHDFAIKAPWTRSVRGNGVQYMPTSASGVDRPGVGAFCMPFRVPRSGVYYTTFQSCARHKTRNNDAWLRMTGGFQFYEAEAEAQAWTQGEDEWARVYQTEGGTRGTDVLLAGDGRRLFSKALRTDRTYHVCLSGRSSKFRIFAIDLVWCGGHGDCDPFGPTVQSGLRSLTAAKCA